MADSDSVESSTSGAECDGRLRSVGKDMTNRMSTDKQTPNKSKSSSSDAPQIGASYLVHRHDDTCRKSDAVGLSKRRRDRRRDTTYV